MEPVFTCAKRMRLESKLKLVQEYRKRYIWLVLAVVLFFLILIVRLAYLQLIKGDSFLLLSQQNFVQERVVPTFRGRIFDTDGKRLAENKPAYNVYITPAFLTNPENTLVKLEGYLNLSEKQSLRLQHSYEKSYGLLRFREILVKSDISRDQLALLESHKLMLPGVSIRPGPKRYYNYDDLFAHVIGYVGRISERELKNNKQYLAFDQIGKQGIEKTFEHELKGTHGLERVVVDARGRIKSEHEAKLLIQDPTYIAPIPGHDLNLSLDLDLQKVAHSKLGANAGAVVVMDVNTGFVKAWVSKPGFDPNKFVGGISHLDWSEYRDSILDPLLDKVCQGSYFPGSTYKVVPAITALESGQFKASDKTRCLGVKYLGKHPFHCWNRGGHGLVNLRSAIKESCDVYFYWVAETLGYAPIYKMAKAFGTGETTGVGINSETKGLLPTEEWHEKAHSRRWFTGDTLAHAIGQGDLKMSPLQLAVLYAAIANGGDILKPQIVTGISDSNGNILKEFAPEVKRYVEISPSTLKTVRDGLWAVVNEKGGTGYLSRLIKPQFVGKTGTAQVVRLPQNKRAHDDYLLKDHAWFVAYAPYDKPQIVVSAVAEHGEHGSWVAPIVREIVAAWYEKYSGEKAERPAFNYKSSLLGSDTDSAN